MRASTSDESRRRTARDRCSALQDPIGFYEQEFARYVDVSKGLLEPLCCNLLSELRFTDICENGQSSHNKVEIKHKK